MSKRRSKINYDELDFPSTLILAENWSRKIGKKVKKTEAILPDKKKLPILAISHGKMLVYVRAEHKIIVIFTKAEVPNFITEQLKKLKKEKQEIILDSLKQQLLSHGRTGYYLDPLNASIISDLKGFTIEQRIRISNKDSGSFNRFLDAIQEVVTVTIRALTLFGVLPSEPSSTGIIQMKPPDEMYA
jgi:hypothetical protein